MDARPHRRYALLTMSRRAVIAAFALIAAALGYLSFWRPLASPPPAPAARRASGSGAASAADLQRGYGLIQAGSRESLTEASRLFAEATAADPESPEAWFGRGWALQLLGDGRGAEPCFLRATALSIGRPASADTAYFAAYDLGVLYADERRFAEALGAFERASALRPSEGRVWGRLGRVYLELGASSRALSSLEKARSLGDASVEADLARARALPR